MSERRLRRRRKGGRRPQRCVYRKLSNHTAAALLIRLVVGKCCGRCLIFSSVISVAVSIENPYSWLINIYLYIVNVSRENNIITYPPTDDSVAVEWWRWSIYYYSPWNGQRSVQKKGWQDTGGWWTVQEDNFQTGKNKFCLTS